MSEPRNGVHESNGHTTAPFPATDAALRQEEGEATLRQLARLVAEELKIEALRPLVRELVLFAELEREAINSHGAARSLLFGLRKAGIRVRLDEQGRLMIGPPKLLTREWKRFIGIYRSELIRELNYGW